MEWTKNKLIVLFVLGSFSIAFLPTAVQNSLGAQIGLNNFWVAPVTIIGLLAFMFFIARKLGVLFVQGQLTLFKELRLSLGGELKTSKKEPWISLSGTRENVQFLIEEVRVTTGSRKNWRQYFLRRITIPATPTFIGEIWWSKKIDPASSAFLDMSKLQGERMGDFFVKAEKPDPARKFLDINSNELRELFEKSEQEYRRTSLVLTEDKASFSTISTGAKTITELLDILIGISKRN